MSVRAVCSFAVMLLFVISTAFAGTLPQVCRDARDAYRSGTARLAEMENLYSECLSHEVGAHNREVLLLDLARRYLEEERYFEAEAYSAEAIATTGSAKAYYSRGLIRYLRGEYERSAWDYDEAIRIRPEYADAYWGRALVRAGQREPEQAVADFTEYIRLKPDDPEGYRNRAVAYWESGDMDRAHADARKATAMDPGLSFPFPF